MLLSFSVSCAKRAQPIKHAPIAKRRAVRASLQILALQVVDLLFRPRELLLKRCLSLLQLGEVGHPARPRVSLGVLCAHTLVRGQAHGSAL